MKCDLAFENESALTAFAADFSKLLMPPLVVFLEGELGAGKTTLVRAILRNQGVTGAIKSPTFSLLETYSVLQGEIYHFDLYRLETPEEFENLGFRDYLDTNALCFIEWADRATELLPIPDLRCSLRYEGEGRALQLTAETPRGESTLASLHTALPGS